jgi:hypothetical protein
MMVADSNDSRRRFPVPCEPAAFTARMLVDAPRLKECARPVSTCLNGKCGGRRIERQ